ncbi:Crp/Fnr family transcriptional regulator [Mucilaginibacter sp.]|uniref:Crp/Fnr family transcriptional regulator n=1 Tax=Mucilaginibacter sp. TaxID=1882438 RepID=UPI00262AC01D|nr:Crp/Fnr family transcriptional regulator [Mucilaginibacter sp.]MDB5126190.1 cyclic nucleotide-binding protein [Mucilaginibacter sp.]
MSIEKLKQHFDNYFPLNAEELNALSTRFAQRSVKRRQFVLQQGDVCRHFTFVISGCLKMYAVDKNGKEHNLQFIAENDWATDLSSFYSEKPSQLYIEAIEPTMILQAKHEDVLHLYTRYHKFDHNFRVIIEQKYIELQDRVLQNISSSAEERYEYFLKQYPDLFNRLPNTQIASYLGITPEFLSTIRKTRVKS